MLFHDLIEVLLLCWRKGKISCPSCGKLYVPEPEPHQDNAGVRLPNGLVFPICFACRTNQHWFDEHRFTLSAVKRNRTAYEIHEAIMLIRHNRFAASLARERIARCCTYHTAVWKDETYRNSAP